MQPYRFKRPLAYLVTFRNRSFALRRKRLNGRNGAFVHCSVHCPGPSTFVNIFGGSKRASKTKPILKAFWHRFWDDFRGPGNVKNEQKRGRVALFLIFGVCKIRCRFGAVLGGSWRGFWEHFGACELDFRSLERRQISKPMLKAEKSGFRVV